MPKAFSRAIVQFVHGLLNLPVRQFAEVGSLGQVLPDEPVGVFILEQSKDVYSAAKKKNPARWSGQIRSWNRIENIWLNPPKDVRAEAQKLALVA